MKHLLHANSLSHSFNELSHVERHGNLIHTLNYTRPYLLLTLSKTIYFFNHSQSISLLRGNASVLLNGFLHHGVRHHSPLLSAVTLFRLVHVAICNSGYTDCRPIINFLEPKPFCSLLKRIPLAAFIYSHLCNRLQPFCHLNSSIRTQTIIPKHMGNRSNKSGFIDIIRKYGADKLIFY